MRIYAYVCIRMHMDERMHMEIKQELNLRMWIDIDVHVYS